MIYVLYSLLSLCFLFFLMLRRPPRSTRTDTLFPYTTLFRSRYAVIQMDVRGRDADSFVQAAEAAIDQQMELPTGYWIEWGGAFENQQRAMAKMAVIVPITIFFIFVLLYTAFNSIKYAALILANDTFATIGGPGAMVVHGQYRSEEHTSELQSLMRISYAVFCLKKKIIHIKHRLT